MTLTPQEQEAMAVADRAKPYVEASRGQTIDPPSSEEIALVDLAALVRRLLEREKALEHQVKEGCHRVTDLGMGPKAGWFCWKCASLSALNPGEKK
jgi:hypothetical protein